MVWDSSQRNIAPNGAVMRTSILGIHEFMSLERVKENTVNVCKCSHADPRYVYIAKIAISENSFLVGS